MEASERGGMSLHTCTLFAGPGGLRTILSFVITVLAIGKLMVPAALRGAPPLLVGLAAQPRRRRAGLPPPPPYRVQL